MWYALSVVVIIIAGLMIGAPYVMSAMQQKLKGLARSGIDQMAASIESIDKAMAVGTPFTARLMKQREGCLSLQVQQQHFLKLLEGSEPNMLVAFRAQKVIGALATQLRVESEALLHDMDEAMKDGRMQSVDLTTWRMIPPSSGTRH